MASSYSLFDDPQYQRPERMRAYAPNRVDYYRRHLGSVQWQHTRGLALERAGFRCSNCGSEARLVVHHDNYDHVGDEWPADLRVLCWNCHSWEHERRAA